MFQRRRESKSSPKIFGEIVVENLPNLGNETVTQVWEMKRNPYRINPMRNTPRHTVTKMTKTKDIERLLTAVRERQYRGIPITLSVDFSAEILDARRDCHDIFKVMEGKNLQPIILYPASLSFRFDGEIKRQQLSVY